MKQAVQLSPQTVRFVDIDIVPDHVISDTGQHPVHFFLVWSYMTCVWSRTKRFYTPEKGEYQYWVGVEI